MAGLSRRLTTSVFIAAFVGAAPAAAYEEVLYADNAHSSVEFRTRHWGIVDIIGWFEDFDIQVDFKENDVFETATVSARVGFKSVRMPNLDMAANLRGIFDAENHPDLMFSSDAVIKTGDSTYSIRGDLTMRGITRRVEWQAVFNGFGLAPAGIPGFTAVLTIDLKDYGIADPLLFPPNATPVIGELVRITCNVRLIDEQE